MNAIIITAIILTIVLVVIFFALRKRRQKNDQSGLLKIFKKLVKENGLMIHYNDVLQKKIISFDRINKKILLLDLNKKNKLALCINMEELISCKIIEVKDLASKRIKQVSLEFVHKDNHNKNLFCFYDDAYDDTDDFMFLRMKARHWNQRINYHKTYWWIKPESIYYENQEKLLA